MGVTRRPDRKSSTAETSDFGVYDRFVPLTLRHGAMAKKLAIICFAVFVLLLCASWFLGSEEVETTPDYTTSQILLHYLFGCVGFVWFLFSGFLAFYGIAGFCDRVLSSG